MCDKHLEYAVARLLYAASVASVEEHKAELLGDTVGAALYRKEAADCQKAAHHIEFTYLTKCTCTKS